jgi:hypothetical protein
VCIVVVAVVVAVCVQGLRLRPIERVAHVSLTKRVKGLMHALFSKHKWRLKDVVSAVIADHRFRGVGDDPSAAGVGGVLTAGREGEEEGEVAEELEVDGDGQGGDVAALETRAAGHGRSAVAVEGEVVEELEGEGAQMSQSGGGGSGGGGSGSVGASGTGSGIASESSPGEHGGVGAAGSFDVGGRSPEKVFVTKLVKVSQRSQQPLRPGGGAVIALGGLGADGEGGGADGGSSSDAHTKGFPVRVRHRGSGRILSRVEQRYWKSPREQAVQQERRKRQAAEALMRSAAQQPPPPPRSPPPAAAAAAAAPSRPEQPLAAAAAVTETPIAAQVEERRRPPPLQLPKAMGSGGLLDVKLTPRAPAPLEPAPAAAPEPVPAGQARVYRLRHTYPDRNPDLTEISLELVCLMMYGTEQVLRGGALAPAPWPCALPPWGYCSTGWRRRWRRHWH